MAIVKPLTDEEIADYRDTQRAKLAARIAAHLEPRITEALAAGQRVCTVSVSNADLYCDSDELREAQGAVHAALSNKYTGASIATRWIPDWCFPFCWKPNDVLQATLTWI